MRLGEKPIIRGNLDERVFGYMPLSDLILRQKEGENKQGNMLCLSPNTVKPEKLHVEENDM